MPKEPVRRVAERTREIADRFAAPSESWRDMTARQWLELATILAPALLLVIGAFWLATRFVEPAPPRTIAITTGGTSGAYFGFGKRYAEALKRSGITLEVKPSAGSVENLSRLTDPAASVQVALLQGGTSNSERSPGIVSLGRVLVEPTWIFYRSAETLDRLTQVKGLRIAVGAPGSGTRMLTHELLKANGVTPENSTFLDMATGDAAEAIRAGAADVVFFSAAPSAPAVQALLRMPGLKLMSLLHAEGYTRVFPYLQRIVLPRGAVDLAADLPARDVEMVGPVAALVAREDLHPALVGLLVEAAKDIHAGGGMFNRIGEFPKPLDPEFPVSDQAERIYQSGPPFLQRYLPFWLANFIERMKVMVLPVLTILIPLIKIVPAMLRWRIRRRLLYWYGQLKTLEHSVHADASGARRDDHRAEMARIEQGVGAIPIPSAFHEQYYSLRAAVDLVRNRIAA